MSARIRNYFDVIKHIKIAWPKACSHFAGLLVEAFASVALFEPINFKGRRLCVKDWRFGVMQCWTLDAGIMINWGVSLWWYPGYVAWESDDVSFLHLWWRRRCDTLALLSGTPSFVFIESTFLFKSITFWNWDSRVFLAASACFNAWVRCTLYKNCFFSPLSSYPSFHWIFSSSRYVLWRPVCCIFFHALIFSL